VTALHRPPQSPPAARLHSALYVGTVRHRRFDRTGHGFSMRLYFAYVDLDELPRAFDRWWWSATHPAPVRFRRRDYFGSSELPLADAVRDAVNERIGVRPDGPVRLLTNLRCWGYVFNPVSFYYCFDRDEHLVAVLADVTNTPWGERHHYVVGPPAAGERTLRAAFPKAHHVSPFQPMELGYRWTVPTPGERLVVHMISDAAGDKVFDATLVAARREWTTRNLLLVLTRHPWMTAKVVAMIYLHAFLLWCKRATFHVHPKKRCPARS